MRLAIMDFSKAAVAVVRRRTPDPRFLAQSGHTCESGKVDAGYRRIGDLSFLDLDPWDGQFDQAVFPDDAVPARASEGYVVAIGRRVEDKQLPEAEELAKTLGKELSVLTDMPHADVMEVLAGADVLMLPSKNETFSIVAFEAVCHGVPVTCMDVPPALQPYPYLTWPWGEWMPTTLDEREGMQEMVRETCGMEALERRFESLLELNVRTRRRLELVSTS